LETPGKHRGAGLLRDLPAIIGRVQPERSAGNREVHDIRKGTLSRRGNGGKKVPGLLNQGPGEGRQLFKLESCIARQSDTTYKNRPLPKKRFPSASERT